MVKLTKTFTGMGAVNPFRIGVFNFWETAFKL